MTLTYPLAHGIGLVLTFTSHIKVRWVELLPSVNITRSIIVIDIVIKQKPKKLSTSDELLKILVNKSFDDL